MRTTLELPDDLVRAMKIRAAQTDSTLTSVITQALRAGLDAESPSRRERVTFPLVRGTKVAAADDLSPERIADLDAEPEVGSTGLTA